MNLEYLLALVLYHVSLVALGLGVSGEYLSWAAAASHRHWDTIATLDIPIVHRSSNHAGNFNTARDKTQGSRPVIDSVNSLIEGTDAIVRQPYHHPVRRNPHSATAKIL